MEKRKTYYNTLEILMEKTGFITPFGKGFQHKNIYRKIYIFSNNIAKYSNFFVHDIFWCSCQVQGINDFLTLRNFYSQARYSWPKISVKKKRIQYVKKELREQIMSIPFIYRYPHF